MLRDNLKRINMDAEEFCIAFCHKFGQLNVLALFEFLGEQTFLEFLEKFGGNYVKVPSVARINDFFERQRLLHIYKLLTAAYKRKDVKAWEVFERQFLFECKKMKIRYETGRQLVLEIDKSNREALSWLRNLKAMESRQDRKEL